MALSLYPGIPIISLLLLQEQVQFVQEAVFDVNLQKLRIISIYNGNMYQEQHVSHKVPSELGS